jgi:hypothetical protein
MVGVRTAEEVRMAVEAPALQRPDGLREFLRPYIESFDSEEEWADLLLSEDPALRAAAQRRQRDV